MKRYFRFLSQIYLARLGKDLSQLYIQIIMQRVGSLCFFYFHLLAFGFIIQRFTFPGWSESQMYILFFTFEIYTYLAFFIFWKGLMQTVNFIHGGQFDLILTKPAKSWVISFFQGGGLHNILAAVLGAAYLIAYLIKYNFSVSPLSLFLFIISILTSLLFLLCFTSIFISLNFYYGRLNVFGIGFTFQELMKYPAQIFPLHQLLFSIFIIPFSLLVTVPASLLIGKPIEAPYTIIYIVSVLSSFILSQIIWHRSLRHYSSASS